MQDRESQRRRTQLRRDDIIVDESASTAASLLCYVSKHLEYSYDSMCPFSDLHSEHLDAHSVVCYLMTLYLSLLGKSSIGTLQNTLQLVR
ncbi:hypothetical protein ANCCEY_02067 [Ancylostoma ceylanicum]|uniref:Uncharacterized protein n=1 Tax=Ancylostoma ceylanicum TaxID=53326 RepID=A0A0D6M440_9BILA|nr:hypothetical protein ANCCEY_02067 [Ancylostoma ceylanicum]